MEVDSDASCVSEIVEIYVHGLVAAAMSLQVPYLEYNSLGISSWIEGV